MGWGGALVLRAQAGGGADSAPTPELLCPLGSADPSKVRCLMWAPTWEALPQPACPSHIREPVSLQNGPTFASLCRLPGPTPALLCTPAPGFLKTTTSRPPTEPLPEEGPPVPSTPAPTAPAYKLQSLLPPCPGSPPGGGSGVKLRNDGYLHPGLRAPTALHPLLPSPL